MQICPFFEPTIRRPRTGIFAARLQRRERRVTRAVERRQRRARHGCRTRRGRDRRHAIGQLGGLTWGAGIRRVVCRIVEPVPRLLARASLIIWTTSRSPRRTNSVEAAICETNLEGGKSPLPNVRAAERLLHGFTHPRGDRPRQQPRAPGPAWSGWRPGVVRACCGAAQASERSGPLVRSASPMCDGGHRGFVFVWNPRARNQLGSSSGSTTRSPIAFATRRSAARWFTTSAV